MIARLLISPSIKTRVDRIDKILSQAGLMKNHPDVLYYEQSEKLGIEQARKIKEYFSLKPYSAKGRAVVLEEASNLTVEAQNALLKILEELPAEAIFILASDSESRLLPTVVSRCQIINLGAEKYNNYKNYTKNLEVLLKADIPERFEYIKNLKDREQFLYSLISFFHKKLPSNADFVKELLQAEEWARHNVNMRAILEYLMLVMPQKV